LDISLDQKNPTSAFIKITLNPEDYQSDWDKKIKEYGKTAQIKGFRPGKAPFGMLKKLVGKSILADLVFRMSDEKLNAFIKEQDLNLLGDPIFDENSPIDWDQPGTLEFQYEIGLAAPFDLDLASIKVKTFKIKVTEKELDETIENLRKDLGEEESLKKVEKGTKIGLLPLGADAENYREFEWEKLPKAVQKTLSGMEVDAEVELALADLQDETANRKWLGQEEGELPATQTFKIHHVSRQIPAEMDQAFFDKALGEGKAQNEEEFKNQVRDIIAMNYQQNADRVNSDALFEAVVSNTTFDIPKDFLVRWLSKRNEGSSLEQEQEKWEQNEKFIRWEIITSKITKEQNINVTQEEVVDKTMRFFEQQFGGSFGDSEEAKNQLKTLAEGYLKRDDGKNFRDMFNNVMGDKVMSYIQEHITKETVELSYPEFLEQQ
jgi:trigger factor